ncbi:MAG TPA: diacylglycerol kinase [Campylobacterales bacterium]|nr:diacylglycerol kinase [Campylobacterales bacterium]HIO71250.1 diacylglycerol kinase [Campylobacterales bacterium]
MKLNKPKYHLFRNATYALEGLKDAIQHETSFRLQLVAFAIFSIIAFSLPIDEVSQYILFLSLFLNLIAEIVNSAIERVVDLCTQEIHPLAKRAKDLGATIVFLSIVFTLIVWGVVLKIELY